MHWKFLPALFRPLETRRFIFRLSVFRTFRQKSVFLFVHDTQGKSKIAPSDGNSDTSRE